MPVKKENKIPFLKWLADVKRTDLKVLPINCEPSCQTQGKRIDNFSNGYFVLKKYSSQYLYRQVKFNI